MPGGGFIGRGGCHRFITSWRAAGGLTSVEGPAAKVSGAAWSSCAISSRSSGKFSRSAGSAGSGAAAFSATPGASAEASAGSPASGTLASAAGTESELPAEERVFCTSSKRCIKRAALERRFCGSFSNSCITSSRKLGATDSGRGGTGLFT